ncbi:uncharacterized protein B0T15DRAFT_508558 [Chaetomium strumarium]|uniref:Uncharacterized protein n=1 Tax=Chaetomium strumarium TaxID=1170767 RepID=A0AAJ0M3W0_9PEZI|nr:hypothetical protein B0T15DRAFT_508558 [Chaetomium strumarium]
MAGRPRRRRSSSAPSVENGQSHIRYSKESSMLRKAPQDVPVDEIPSYVLTDASIYQKDGKSLANPLLINVQGPVMVRGFLEEVEEKWHPYLVRSSVKSGYIEIPHSEEYSISDGPLAFWVTGASGFFEIRPSRIYQPMYDQMIEAITLYYSALEVYDEYEKQCGQKKKRNWPSPPTLDDIFLRYAVRAGDGILRDEVEPLCHKWAEFMIAHFPKEVDLDWELTYFAKWLRDAHPDIEKKIHDIAKGIIPPQPPPETQNSDESRALHKRGSTTVKRGVEKRDSRSPPPKISIPRKAKTSETPIPLPEKYRQHVQATSVKSSSAPIETSRSTPTETPAAGGDADSPVDRLLGALQEICEETDIKKITQSKLHSMLYFKCRIPQYNVAKDVTSFYAKELLLRLSPEWKGTPWYEWLKDAATQPWVPGELTAEMVPSMTIRRTKMKKQQPDPSNRPAAELPASLNIKARTRSGIQEESEGETDDEDVTALQALPPMRSRRSGKAAGLRLVTSGKKRPHSDMDELVVQSRRGRKSAKTIHRERVDDDVQEDASDDEVAGDEDLDVGSSLPPPEGAVRLVVHAERLPSTNPTGPDGTWTCDQEGCTYVVRSADDEDGQQLIQEHFREHEAQAAKINLALKESRGHMPINHLLDKIQAIGRAALKKKRGTLNGKPVPAPVKRRLLI